MASIRFLVFCFCIFFATDSLAQLPISWNFFAKKIDDKTYELHFSAAIQNSWHTYSQNTPEGGPSPTKIVFTKNPLCVQTGKIKEIGVLENVYDVAFGVNVKSFSSKVDFVQIVKLKTMAKTSQSGTLEFMVCNDHECLPPKTIPFSISLN